MKKILCILLGFSICMTSCSRNQDKEPEKMVEYDVPSYNIEEIGISDSISRINGIELKNDEMYIYGDHIRNSVTVKEENILTGEIVTSFEAEYGLGGQYGQYHNHSYYEKGVQYNESGNKNSGIELITSDIADSLEHWSIADMYVSENDEIIYIAVNLENQPYMIWCDADNRVTDIKEIRIPEGYGISCIDWYEDSYYIGAYSIEYDGVTKSYPSSVFIFDENLDIHEEIIDIELEQIQGIVCLNEKNFVVYSYDEYNDKTYLSVSDGDMTTYSEVIEFQGRSRFFPSKNAENVYVTENSAVYEFNIFNDEKKLITEIETENTNDFEIVYCDGNTVSYVISGGQTTVNYLVDKDSNLIVKDENRTEYEHYFNEDEYIVKNITDGTEMVFGQYDGDYELIENNGLFWGIDKNGRAVTFDIHGNKKIFSENLQYTTESLFLSGDVPSAVYMTSDNYYYGVMNTESMSFDDSVKLKDKSNLQKAEVWYLGSGEYLFYVQINGYILGFNKDNLQFDALIDLAELNIDSFLLGIRNTESGKFQLITDCTIYNISEKTSENTDIPIITVGNLTHNDYLQNYFGYDSDKYKIKLINYLDEENQSVDYEIFNNDILSGNIPDILVSSSYEDISYIDDKKCLMELDESKIFDDSDYLENIVNGFKTDGKLYRIPIGFKINTMLSFSDDIDHNWNYENYLEMVKNGKISGDKYSIFKRCFPYYSDALVEFSNTSANFCSDPFEIIISAAKYYGNDQDVDYSEDTLIRSATIGSDFSGKEYQSGYKICGFPSTDGGESYIHSDMMLSVSQNSNYKEQCIDIIKNSLSFPYGRSFSLNSEDFDKEIDGIRLISDKSFADDIYSIAVNAGKFAHNNNRVDSIIDEEVYIFLYGNIEAEDVSATIRNKINLYLNESE